MYGLAASEMSLLEAVGEDPPAVTQQRSFTKPSAAENVTLWEQFRAVPTDSKANVVSYLEEHKSEWFWSERCGWEQIACNSTYLKEHLVVQCCAPDLNKSSTTMKSTTAISLLKALNKILHWHARH